MNKYKQLTLGQRYEIEVLFGQSKTQNAIALYIGFEKSTVSREIERNSAFGNYSAEEASHRHRHPFRDLGNDGRLRPAVRRREDVGAPTGNVPVQGPPRWRGSATVLVHT